MPEVGPRRPGSASAALAARSFSDVGLVALAAAAVTGATLARPVPGLVMAGAVAAVVLAVAMSRPWVLVAGTAVVASGLGASAWDAAQPLAARPVDAAVVLLGDPEVQFGALRVEARIEHPDPAAGAHVELWARGATRRELEGRAGGERFRVHGRLEPRPAEAVDLAARHVTGRLDADTIIWVDDGDPPARAANALRSAIAAGARSLPQDQRGVFLGLVLGDDRLETDTQIDDFRASGLTHLLVVSGENVAFVLALFGPVLRRLGMRTRALVSIGVVVFFAGMVRFEPSVLRASAMTGVAVLATAAGRPLSARRTLALAVTVLVLIDPLLVQRLGFRLSVAACLGIGWLAEPLARRLRGPSSLRDGLSVTIAAQVGVIPVLAPIFGGVPLVSVPANLLAVPAAGPVMMWGMTAGVLAGHVPTAVAALLHLPTLLAVGWIAWVARVGAGLPLGTLGAAPAMVVAAGVVAALAAGSRPTSGRLVSGARRCGWFAAGLGVLLGVVPGPVPAAIDSAGPGARLAHDSGAAVLVLDGRAQGAAVLRALRAARVQRLDLLVVTSPARGGWDVAGNLADRIEVGQVVGPDGVHDLGSDGTIGAVVAAPPERGDTIQVGSISVVVQEADRARIAVDVALDPGPPPSG